MVDMRAVRAGLLAATAGLALALGSAPASAQRAPTAGATAVERVAAVVNEEAVSLSDVTARIRLTLINAGLPDTAEARQRIQPQVMRQLVDERLQMQEAKRLGITLPDADVDKAINTIAGQVRMSRPQLEKFLADRNVPQSTLADQVRSALSWQRVLQRRIRQEVVIGEDEIDAALEKAKANLGKPEYLAAEIFLAVDNPAQDAEIRRVAERLVEDVHRGGNFAALARQFSQSAGAAQGGDLGWVRSGELSDELDQALQQMRPGQLSAPVRTATGYHLLLVRDRRTAGSGTTELASMPAAPPPRPRAMPKPDLARAKVHLKQIIIPAASKEQVKAVVAQAEKLRKSIKGCADFEQRARESGIPESGDLGTLRVKDLNPQLANLALGIPVGEPSPVLSGSGGAMILIVCSRDVPMIQPKEPEEAAAPPPPPPPQPAKPATLPTREEIEREVLNDRADLLSRRYLRDLRRAAFIEYRVQ